MIKKKFKLISTFFLIFILILTLFFQPVYAQESEEEPGVQTGMFVHWFDVTPETSCAEIDYFNGTTEINLYYEDLWNWWVIPFAVPWLPNTWNPKNWFQNWNDPLPEASTLSISEPVRLSVEFLDGDSEGWNVYLGLTNFSSYLGTTRKNITLFVSIDGPISKRFEEIRIVGTMGDPEAEEPLYTHYCTLLLKAINFSRANLYSDENKDIKSTPRSILSYPIEIENKGYLRDTFVFKSSATKKGGPRGWNSSIGGSVILEPGEKTTVYLSIKTPDKFYEASDINIITVDVYSKDNLDRSLDTLTVSVKIEGFDLSPLLFFSLFLGIIILLVVIFIILKFKKRIVRKLRKDKKKKEQQKKVKEPKKVVKKEQKIEPVKQQKSTLAVEKIKPKIDKRKEKALQKVRREQEKQKNKYQS